MKTSRLLTLLIIPNVLVFLAACTAVETSRTLTPQTVESHDSVPAGEKVNLVVSQFHNRSNYLQGVFSSGIDYLGNQSKTILETHLQQSNRFNVLDRDNLQQISKEAELSGAKQKLTGARYAITGDVTEYGRKNIGDQQFFGILGKGRKQIAYAKVQIQIVDVESSSIVYTTQGAGEYELSNREVVGFGSTASYDSTLNGKVLNLAITEAVNSLVKDLDSGEWQAESNH